MLFVRRPTVVVEDDPVARAEATELAEERGRVSGTVAALGVIAVLVILLVVGYFAWWAPVNAANAQNTPVIEHDTTTVQQPVPAPSNPPTIINNPPAVPPPANPPTIIHQDHIVPVPVPVPTTGGNSGSSNNGSTNSGSNNNGNGGDTGTNNTSGNGGQ